MIEITTGQILSASTMTDKQVADKILASLKQKTTGVETILLDAAKSYYNTGSYAKYKTWTITDGIFDRLQDALRTLNPTSKVLKQIGAPVKGRSKVALPYPMFSLDKVKPESADNWLASHKGPYVVSLKLDGASAEIVYQKDGTAKLYTRGNGTVGQDISHILPHLKVPQKLKRLLAVRGEVVMPDSVFDAKYSDVMENPRNMVSGVLNSKKVVGAVQDVDFIAHSALEPRLKPSEQFALLKKLGFKVVEHVVKNTLKQSQLSTLYVGAKKKSRHAIDGLVITQDVKVGLLQDGNPEHAVAYKEQQDEDVATTTVLDVEWNISKHNKLVPLIKIKPVRISGSTINNVTGHNFWFIKNGYRSKDKDKNLPIKPIGKGAIVTVIKAGEIIPHIVDVIKPVKQPQLPTIPYKEGPTGIDIYALEQTTESADKLLTQFFKELEIENISLTTVVKFKKAGLDTVTKIIQSKPTDFEKVDGVKSTMALKYYKSIHAKLIDIPLERLMTASGCFGLGMGKRRIAAILKVYPDVLTMPRKNLAQKLVQIEGFAETTASMFVAGLDKYTQFVKDTKLKGVVTKAKAPTGSILKGQKILFTGFRSKQLEAEIADDGGEVVSGPAKMTILLAKDPHENSAKLNAARVKGIPIMTEEQFRKKYRI